MAGASLTTSVGRLLPANNPTGSYVKHALGMLGCGVFASVVTR